MAHKDTGSRKAKGSKSDLHGWTVKDSAELYNVANWGDGYFRINKAGHLEVNPGRDPRWGIDVKLLVDDLVARGIPLPLLLRFSDILESRVQTLASAFAEAIAQHDYKGVYRGVYPVKVNQQRHIVEELVRFAEPRDMGLEAGSKSELLMVVALLENPRSLIVCNGYKDEEYIETALLATKLGRNVVLVVEKYTEIEAILEVAERLDVTPTLGVRMRPAARGAGRWEGSAGDRSKFGLSIQEIVDGVELLRERGHLGSLKLLHFHIGSQVSAIRAINSTLREAARMFVELYRMGAPLTVMDVGGGLGVDYDGSRTNFPSSVNYSTLEYAADVVSALQAACDEHDIPHPDIVSESGRALVAHSSVLVTQVLGTSCPLARVDEPVEVPEEDPDLVWDLIEVRDAVSRKSYQEAYHDAMQLREEALTRFELGLLNLDQRARVERIFWQTCARILAVVRTLSYVPDEFEGLEKALADTYYCNFSVFQSAPDSWAVEQLFPIMPIHRLGERPTRRAVLADITCDSDGKIDTFIDLRDVKDVLELHPLEAEDYLIGVFLVGAYQEILGDLHNLFGDTNAVHVSLDEEGDYRIDSVVEGDRVSDVLGYVSYNTKELITRVRAACEKALKAGRIDLALSKRIVRAYQTSLDGYTYLE
ncbi:MAG: biosynthetic arginine decarboxylase [Deltaproteobacteria bacterium]|nr:biosynthetic arginine decarboxylase [Deltaproteobacteria bacterium]